MNQGTFYKIAIPKKHIGKTASVRVLKDDLKSTETVKYFRYTVADNESFRQAMLKAHAWITENKPKKAEKKKKVGKK